MNELVANKQSENHVFSTRKILFKGKTENDCTRKQFFLKAEEEEVVERHSLTQPIKTNSK